MVAAPDGSTGGQAAPSRHLARLSRVFSEETWSVYELLDRSLAPRGPDCLHVMAGEHLRPGAAVLDAGCRDAAHLIRLARLRRQRESIASSHGDDIYRHVEANLHWEVFQLLGKLRSIVYLLSPGRRVQP